MRRRHLGIAVVAAAILCLGLLLPGLLDRAQVPAPNHDLLGDAVWGPRTHPAPDFVLRNQGGHEVDLRQFRGSVVLLTFMDSLCTTDCPVEAAELHLAQQRLGRAASPVILIVTTDPEGDSPASIQKFASKYHLRPPYEWLNGSTAALAKVWREYQIEVSSASTHSSAIYLIDRFGDEREGWGVPFPPQDFVKSVRALATRYYGGWRWPWAF